MRRFPLPNLDNMARGALTALSRITADHRHLHPISNFAQRLYFGLPRGDSCRQERRARPPSCGFIKYYADASGMQRASSRMPLRGLLDLAVAARMAASGGSASLLAPMRMAEFEQPATACTSGKEYLYAPTVAPLRVSLVPSAIFL